ncbi:DNA-binding protein [Actinoplanes philippinensis]|uniref:DNA-binding protein n=1 Tax=Actinoplanes philippinensis TaxID=35752 RepID=UPI0034073E0F
MVRRSLYLVGNYEIRMLLGGLSRQRAYLITRQPGFPEPIAELGQGKVWLGEQVEEWIKKHRPRGVARKRLRPGSPPATGQPGSPDD